MDDRNPETRRPRLLPTLALAGLLLLPLAACGGAAEDTTTPAATETAAADDTRTYQVRGQITGLPDDADPQANLTIRHEAIDDFVSMSGEVVGMNAMSMPFPVADDVAMEGFEVGDKVAFTLEVDWDGDPAYQVTSMETLPAETELEYRKAQVDGEGTDSEDAADEDAADEDAADEEMESGGTEAEGDPAAS